jgi:hypothetical protein
VLETERRRKGKRCERLGCVQPRLSSVWHTGLSGGAPDSVRCARLNSGEQAALGRSLAAYGYNSPDCPVCTGLSGEPTVGWANGRPRNPRVTRGRANGHMGHQTVSGAPTTPRQQRSTAPFWEGNRPLYGVRWCTGLSGAPPNRKLILASK